MIEVMIAAVILALLIASSVAAMRRTFPAVESARNVAIAGQILQTEVERLRLRDWATVSTLVSATLTVDPSFTSNPIIANRFALTRTVTTPKVDMREITFTVTWASPSGRPLSRSYMTRYARYGMYDYLFNTK